MNVDNAKCRGEFKLAVYERYALPSLRYHLSVHTLHKTHLASLDMLAKSFIKKWLGIPTWGVTDVAIFHPYMLNVKQPSALYLENHAGNHTIMRLTGDIVVKAAIDSQVTRENEWTKKSSTAVTCDQMFATCVEKNQIFVPNSENTWNYEFSMRHEIPKAKSAIKESVILDDSSKTSQELRMLSSVTLNCQATKIVMDSGAQL